MKVSVIFTTYNSEAWLEKVLWGFACQTYTDFDIVIADDGSTVKTSKLIARLASELGLSVQHIWQEDKGFRKCRILNKAIAQVDSGYLVFTDGDCIPRSDFVAEHVKHASEGYYLSGSYFKLPMETSQSITREDIESQSCFDVAWLQQHGLPRLRKTLKLRASKSWASWLNRLTPTRCNLKGSNASLWLKDALAINGYDERMHWGGEDREFGVRLQNLGIKPRHVRYNAVCVHLDHARAYKDAQKVAENKRLRIKSDKENITLTEYGIAQLNDK